MRTHEFFHVLRIVTLVVLRGQSQHYQSARFELVIHLYQLRHFQAARSTPGGPDVYYDDLVCIIRKLERFALEGFNLRVAHLLRQTYECCGRRIVRWWIV